MNTIIALLFLALWTAAWLHWFFAGELRQFLFAYVFPESWRAGYPTAEILLLDDSELEFFLNAESQAWPFVRGVLSCPGCLSAYLSAAGIPFAIVGFMPSLWVIPLLWAGGAWLGHRLFNHF